MLNEKLEVIRTERIWVKSNKELRRLCHISKNLFNEANYFIRQEYFTVNEIKTTKDFQIQLNQSENYSKLSPTTAMKILNYVDQAWKSYSKMYSDWKKNPSKYFEKPCIPKYKKKDGEFILPFGKNQIKFDKRKVIIPEIKFEVKTRLLSTTKIIGARMIPRGVGYIFEILYYKKVKKLPDYPSTRIVGIDIGLTNLITMVNNIGKKPIVVKGGVAKSINQFYNKERSRLQGVYDKQIIYTGKKLHRLTDKRNRKLNHYFHEISYIIVDWCMKNKIDTIVIGRNKFWKQHMRLGKRNNQNFVYIPFNQLIHKIQYKAKDTGIKVIITREDYTSKCSFLDKEMIVRHSKYEGERISRGLFQTSTGLLINSDVNGGYNIIKKAVPDAFSQWETDDGIEGVWLHPIRFKTIGSPMLIEI